jgi:hypothetical protein
LPKDWLGRGAPASADTSPGGTPSFRRALPALRALAGSDPDLSPLERELVEVVREAGPLTHHHQAAP